jgi:hypothetical protein
MKLFELTGISRDDMFNAAAQSRRSGDDFEELRDQLTNLGKDKVRIGDGLYSVVLADPDRAPGSVRKIAYGEHGRGYTIQKLAKDAYYNYILEIAKGSMKWNPYLPKVYAIHFHRSKDGLIAFELELERLEELSKLNRREVIAIGSKIFGDPDFEQGIENYMEKQKVTHLSRAAYHNFLLAAVRAKALGINRYYGMRIKDPYLRHALAILSRVKRTDSRIFLDMSTENVMVRRTPVGAQLVLTDPLAEE